MKASNCIEKICAFNSAMNKTKFYYNPHTCQYEPIRLQAGKVLRRILTFCLIVIATGIALNEFYYVIYTKYKEDSDLEKENQGLKMYYEILKEDISQLESQINKLQIRDDELYRTIFQAEPISSNIRKVGVGGRERYISLVERGLQAEDLILHALKRVDRMKKQANIQTKSYIELLTLAKNKENMNASMPAIQPIANKELHRLSSGFGMRIDPIYKIRKMHRGIDFSAPKGTPVYATGAGVVKEVTRKNDGYGKRIRVDHGYGYQTLYAHLSNFNVKGGQKVKRGEHIGFVGNTGKSTSPHLHYEVHYKGEKINPVHFFFQDLSQEEYTEMLRRSSIENQSLE